MKASSKLPSNMLSPGPMGQSVKQSTALVPIKNNDANLRALHEIEKIKEKKRLKEE